MNQIKIPQKRFLERREKLTKQLDQKSVDLFIVTNPTSIYYLTGFSFIPTERPLFLLLERGEINFFVPALEKQHVLEDVAETNKVGTYFEYPDETHPMIHFKHFVKNEFRQEGKIAADSKGARGFWGYQGPSFEEVLHQNITFLPDIVYNMRIIKDPDELACIRESAKWGHLAHKLLQELTSPGKNEIDVSFEASHRASKEMRKQLGPEYQPIGYGARPCGAGYRGQIGSYSAIPHSLTRNAIFKEGDTLITGASANVAGYHSELERTIFLGEPTSKQREYFKIMVEAQQAAFDTLRPGVKMSVVDKATKKVFKDNGVLGLVQHHSGHAIGLEVHERPFLDIGINDPILPNMVFTVEPGIYDRALAGFRHSDTIIITDDGIEIITTYPRDIDSLTLSVN